MIAAAMFKVTILDRFLTAVTNTVKCRCSLSCSFKSESMVAGFIVLGLGTKQYVPVQLCDKKKELLT